MFPSIILLFLSIQITRLTCSPLKSIVIQINGDCKIVADKIAQQHGYRYVREIFHGFCELEEDPLSDNYVRHRRAIEQGIDPAKILLDHENVKWAESQIPKKRQKREFLFNDPEWNNMWYLMRHLNTPSLPDLNVTGAWKMGYTGRGQVVTFLDDGLEFDHPDLQENYDKEASTDINSNDDDPSPRYDPTNENKHGTRCAGEVSAKANNQICGVGVAYHAGVGGIRMLDGDITDSVEARSISHRPDHVDIYSASWGPDDNGLVVDGPGILATKAFENGALKGRDGLGSIFVWASGNGGREGDSCACDGYINSIYTIAVSSVTQTGFKPWYLEECSGTLTTAYSSGMANVGDREIITTDLHHSCTSHHTGTSAAAPLAAAIYALVLEANPKLTWRDIMYITVLGSRPNAIPTNTELVRNAAGFNVSSKYGFGLMDAGLMTWYAAGWTNVPKMSTCESRTIEPKKTIGPNSIEIFLLNLTKCQNNDDIKYDVNYIEQVQIFVTLKTTNRGEIEIYLYSPSNTKTQILPKRLRDHNNQGFSNWAFLTVQLWGEKPHGQWKLQITNTGGGSAVLMSWRLVVHGTRDYPISPHSTPDSNRSNCHVECSPNEPCGNLDTNCTSCRHYKQPLTNGQFRCVGICPEGTYPSVADKLCLSCHSRCGSCRNGTEKSCVSCKSGFYLIPDKMICSEICPEKYFQDTKLRKCIQCKIDCQSCDKDSYTCTSCPSGFALKDADCVKSPKQCESNEYFDFSTDSCRWCDSRCLTCSGSQSYQCTSCDNKSKYNYLEYHSCVSSCSPGYFLSKNLSQCLPCHDACFTCQSSSELSCLSCKIGYIYLADSHRCEKHDGKPFYTDSKTGEIHECHASCAQCKGPKPNDCIACNPIREVLLNDGHCVNDCPLGSYVNQTKTNEIETNICSPCPIGCKRCINFDRCVECETSKGYNLINEKCIPKCPINSFLENTQCKLCQNSCSTCFNLTSCFSCKNSLNLFYDQCVEKCPNTFYLNNRKCLECNPICDTCTGPSEDDCTSCAKGFIFNEKQKKCLNTCPNGNFYSKVDNSCKLCTNNCLECLYPGSYCRQCSFPMSLDIFTHRCLPCCTTNITTNDCCQCPSLWDGFCFHPLVSSIPSSLWWTKSPLERIREGFSGLNRLYQTIILVISIVLLIGISICLIIISIRQFILSRRRSNPTDYIRLKSLHDDLDDHETLNNEY